jgi:hypothetical protein
MNNQQPYGILVDEHQPQYQQQYAQQNQPQYYNPAPVNTSVTTQVSENNDDPSYEHAKLLLILGFFINIVWLVNFITSRGKSRNTQKLGNISCGLLVLTTIIVSALMSVLGWFIYSVLTTPSRGHVL